MKQGQIRPLFRARPLGFRRFAARIFAAAPCRAAKWRGSVRARSIVWCIYTTPLELTLPKISEKRNGRGSARLAALTKQKNFQFL
jgi:hypothetical protein